MEATRSANDRPVELNIVDAGYMHDHGLLGELVLLLAAWKGLRGVCVSVRYAVGS